MVTLNVAILIGVFSVLFGAGLALAIVGVYLVIKQMDLSNKEHTHNTKAGLEDAEMVMTRMIFEAVDTIDRMKKMAQYVDAILGEVDDGPYAYKKDQKSRFDEYVGKRRK